MLAAALQGVDQALAGCLVGRVGDIAGLRFGAGGEEFFFLELEALPRRIAEDDVEAAVFQHDIGEFERPVEVGVLLGSVHGCAEQVAAGVAGEGAADVRRGRGRVRLGFGARFERGEEGVGPEVAGGFPGPPFGALAADAAVMIFRAADLPWSALRAVRERDEFPREIARVAGREVERELALAFFAVLLLIGAGGGFFVAGDGVVRAVGDALFEDVEVEDADEGVAVLDVVVEEGEGEAGGVCFDPEGDFAEVDGEGVLVDGVDAVLDDVAERFAVSSRVGLVLAGADACEFACDAAGGGEQEVS